MNFRGPAPKPTALKQLEGNPGKRALNMNEPQFTPVGDRPEPVAKISEAARRLWDLKWKAIGKSSIRETDLSALTTLIITEAHIFQLSEIIDREGFTVTQFDGKGNKKLVAHPCMALLETERMSALRLWSRFGHTPADRARVMEEARELAKSGVLSGQWKTPELGEAIQ